MAGKYQSQAFAGMSKFYQDASKPQQATLASLLADGKFREAWNLMQKVTGMDMGPLPILEKEKLAMRVASRYLTKHAD